jgi:hypothetical protein
MGYVGAIIALISLAMPVCAIRQLLCTKVPSQNAFDAQKIVVVILPSAAGFAMI